MRYLASRTRRSPRPGFSRLIEIEPRADLEAGTGCIPKLAVAKVNTPFAGLNRGDAETLASMFPEPSDGFVLQPDLEISELQENAITPDEVRQTVRRIGGLHRAHTGTGQPVDYVTPVHTVWVSREGVGPFNWKASGGGTSYGGRGKIAFNCETGRFIRVAF